MLRMTDITDHSPATDVHLLLRAHAEARWLSHEVVPVLREIEREDARSEEHLSAALAYLEVLWLEACDRAAETEATHTELEPQESYGEASLHGRAHRYHAAVRRLRGSVARRVSEILALPDDMPARDRAST
jgi:hypothetical protein